MNLNSETSNKKRKTNSTYRKILAWLDSRNKIFKQQLFTCIPVFLPKNTIFDQKLQLELQVHDRGLLRDVDRHPEANSADLDHRIRTSHPRGEPERGGAQTLPQLNGKHEDIQLPSAGVTGKKTIQQQQ